MWSKHIVKLYEIRSLEIGTDKDHVHFLKQSSLRTSLTQIITMIKSITARETFKRCSEVKKKLWSGRFGTYKFCVSTVGQHENKDFIRNMSEI